METLSNWSGPRPSDVDLCNPEDDLIWMVAYVMEKSAMDKVEAKEAKSQAILREAEAKAAGIV